VFVGVPVIIAVSDFRCPPSPPRASTRTSSPPAGAMRPCSAMEIAWAPVENTLDKFATSTEHTSRLTETRFPKD
jgi:hypothetical protein